MSAVLSAEAPIESTLRHYDVGVLVNAQAASHGIENLNYILDVERDGRTKHYVLTFVQQASYAGHAYVPMMEALVQFGLPVPAPIKNLNGEPVTREGERSAMLQPCLPGRHVVNPTAKQISGLARFIARMHQTMSKTNVTLPPHPRDVGWLQTEAEGVAKVLGYADTALLQASISKVTSLLSRNDVRTLPTGMIHGDLFRDNVLFNERGLTGVLDFHHAADGYWLYDLAVAANDWCSDASGQLHFDRVRTLLRAYHSIRPLTERELWFFSAFTLYAALNFWVSRLKGVVAKQDGQNVRTKDPGEFKRIIQHHSAHQLFLDPRILD